MANEQKKFLDQEGVEILWREILAELERLNKRIEELESIDEVYGGSASEIIGEAE